MGSVVRTKPLYFQGYVYLRTSPEQRGEAVAFWLAQGALQNRQVGERRAAELAYLVRRTDDELAGIATVGRKSVADGRFYYLFRMFLRLEDRTPYLMRAVTNATRDFLRDFEHPLGHAAGMLIVTENRKLMHPGIRRYFERHGYRYRGKNSRGLNLWLAPFDEGEPWPFVHGQTQQGEGVTGCQSGKALQGCTLAIYSEGSKWQERFSSSAGTRPTGR
jgi:hypothetical protein